jgi:hypothetical protein|tara:strand:- start:2837 stop:3181 length:345 start_codon:yes stop_codon:yes gene_type:complete
MDKSAIITLTNDKNKVIAEFMVKKLTIATNARRLSMTSRIIDLDLDDAEKGQLLTCAALAATVYNVDGTILYPDKDGADNLYNEMDIEVYEALCKAYVELNPLEPTLTAKKKKS